MAPPDQAQAGEQRCQLPPALGTGTRSSPLHSGKPTHSAGVSIRLRDQRSHNAPAQ